MSAPFALSRASRSEEETSGVGAAGMSLAEAERLMSNRSHSLLRRPLPSLSRGFTLAELLVGLAVTSIVMTAVVAIFLGVQRSYQAETEVKLITENGRGALLFLERVVPLAGYGLDPRVAIDVSNQAT